MPTRKDWEPLKDGRYEDTKGNFIQITGGALTIGTAFSEIVTVDLMDNIRLSQAKESQNGSNAPALS